MDIQEGDTWGIDIVQHATVVLVGGIYIHHFLELFECLDKQIRNK